MKLSINQYPMVNSNLYRQKTLFFDWVLVFFFSFSLMAILFSFYQEYVEKIQPCTLCKWQRNAHFFIVFLSMMGCIQRHNSSIRWLLNWIFLIGFCLAIYHTSVQLGWLTDRCKMTQNIETINDFMAIFDNPNISCTNSGWKFFGISATIYNMIYCISAMFYLNYRKLKKSYA